MTEINTFSAVVDDVIVRSGRAEKKADIIGWARQTMRECQVKSFFFKDRIEDTITATAEPHIWAYPQFFRQMETIRYGLFDPRGNNIYPKLINPGKKQLTTTYFYYAGTTYFAFKGMGSGTAIDMAYFNYFQPLAYFALADRPATFSLETNSWSYLTAVSDADKLIARDLVRNWLLDMWFDLVVEGTLAKIFKSIGDPRSGSTFALYKSLQLDLLAGEASASIRQ